MAPTTQGNIIAVANQKIAVASKLTPYEAILRGNANRERIADYRFFNEMLLGKDARGNFNKIPDEILNAKPWVEGDYFAVAEKGKALGKYVELEFEYNGRTITSVFEVPQEHRGAIEKMVGFTHGFLPDGTPTIQILDDKGKPILSMDDATDRIFVKSNGSNYTVEIKSRDGGAMDKVGDETTHSWVTDNAAHGLRVRGYYGLYDYNGRRLVDADDHSSYRLGVLYIAREAGGAEISAQQPEAGEGKTAPAGGLKALEADAKTAASEILEIAGEVVSGQVARIRAYFDAVTKE